MINQSSARNVRAEGVRGGRWRRCAFTKRELTSMVGQAGGPVPKASPRAS